MGSRPPPSTPSPHRFATKRDGTAARRFQAPVAPTPSPLGPTERRQEQFATGPRFSFSSRPLKKSEPEVAIQPQTTPTVPRGSALRHVFARAEPIEDTVRDPESADRPGDAFVDDDTELEVPHNRVHDGSYGGSEHHGAPEIDEDLLSDVNEQRYKRRRLSYPDTNIEPHGTTHLEDKRPRRFLPAKVIPALQDPSSTLTDVPERARPSFILPAASHEHHAADDRPLPDVFSPHRKGQKFVPGGMAETVRSWIVDIASSASETNVGSSMSAGSYRPNGHGPIYQLHDVVLRNAPQDPEIPAGAWILVCGTLCDAHGNSRLQMVLLAANASRRYATRLLDDTVLMISPPFLDVNVKGETWLVAVEWSIA